LVAAYWLLIGWLLIGCSLLGAKLPTSGCSPVWSPWLPTGNFEIPAKMGLSLRGARPQKSKQKWLKVPCYCPHKMAGAVGKRGLL